MTPDREEGGGRRREEDSLLLKPSGPKLVFVACPMVAPWQEFVAVGFELLAWWLCIFAIWCGFQLCGEWTFVLIAAARCWWKMSLDIME